MALKGEKISDLIFQKSNEGKPWISFEYFPPKTEKGVENLISRIERMKDIEPLFVDFTWGAGGSTSELSLDLSLKSQNTLKLQTNMHLTCTNMPEAKVDDALERCKNGGIVNILALRGDPPAGQEAWEATEGGFACALDLVKHIREKHGDYFNITVAGYPEGHPTKISLVEGGLASLSPTEAGRCRVVPDGAVYVCSDADFDAELDYLKAKVDAGADAIVTQMFLEAEVFFEFVSACKLKGINVPIIPGIICISAFAGFARMADFCKTRVPESLHSALEAFKDDAEAVKQIGISFGTELCRKLLDGGACGLHFYTLNLETVCVGILEELELLGNYMKAVSIRPKIVDCINKLQAGWVSLEFFPPKTESGVQNLYQRLHRMKALQPVFADFTWGAGGTTSELTLELAARAQNECSLLANMHLTCTNMAVDKIRIALEEAKKQGIRNIVALRGDPPQDQQQWTAAEGGFSCALDLVKHIRSTYGDYFGVSVAGYPEGHPSKITEVPDGVPSLSDAEKGRCNVVVDATTGQEKVFVCRDSDFQGEMEYLKQKVEAGADFIITQMFLDVSVYETFVQQCRQIGITCPVIPGILCINSYVGLKKMTEFCKTRVPKAIWDALEPIKEAADAVKDFGVTFGTQLCRDLVRIGAPGLHFYTLNLETVTIGILEGLGKLPEKEAVPTLPEGLPLPVPPETSPLPVPPENLPPPVPSGASLQLA